MFKIYFKIIFIFAVIFVGVFFFLGPSDVFAAACQSNVASGNWGTAGSWTNCGGVTPQSADTVQIQNGHVITINTNATTTSVTIDSGGTLTEDGGGRILAISGGWTNNGTFTAVSSNIKLTGAQTVLGNTTFNNFTVNPNTSATRTITINTGTTLTINGVFEMNNSSTGVITFGGTGGTIDTHGNVVWDKADTSATANTINLYFSGSSSQLLTVTGGSSTLGGFASTTIAKSGGTLTFSGTVRTAYNFGHTSGTVDWTTNDATIIFTAALTINPLAAANYDNVIFNQNSSSARTFTISSGQVMTVVGTLTVDNSAAGLITLAGGSISAQGDVSFDSTTFASGSTSELRFEGSASQLLTTLGASAGIGLFASTSINKTGGTLTTSGDIRTTKGWVYVQGTVDMVANNTSFFCTTGSAIDGQGTSATMSFNNLGVSGSGTCTIYGDLDVRGDLTINTSASLTNSANFSVNVGGDWNNLGTAYNSGSNTTTLDGSGNASVITGGTSTTKDFHNLTINKTGGGVVTITGFNLDVDNVLAVTAGTLDLNYFNLSTVTTCNITGTLKLTGNETISCTPTFNATSIAEYSATSTTPTIKNWTYQNLYINGSGGSFSLPGNLSLGEGLTIAAGTLTQGSNTVSVTNLATISGGTYSAGTVTSTFNGGLTVSGGTFTGSSGAVDVNGSVTISSGTLTASSGNMTVSGNWTNGGTFTHNSGTVIFDGSGSQQINDDNTFHNLSISASAARAITFEASATQTIGAGGAAIFQGASGNLLTLQSSVVAGAKWNFSIPSGSTRTVDYTAAIDASATNDAIVATNSTCTRTTNWTCTGQAAPAARGLNLFNGFRMKVLNGRVILNRSQ